MPADLVTLPECGGWASLGLAAAAVRMVEEDRGAMLERTKLYCPVVVI